MRRYVEAAVALCVGLALLVAMARVSGFLLIPPALALVLALGYVLSRVVTGEPSPYPRIASGVFERTESERVRLSETQVCDSCSDWEGPGECRLTHREFVFLGVPVVHLSEERTVLCETCADPLAALGGDDAIDRELDRGR